MKDPIKPRNTALAAAITSRKGGIHWTAERHHQEAKKPAVSDSVYALYVGCEAKMKLSDYIADFNDWIEADQMGSHIVNHVFGSNYWIIRYDKS